jgi:hypothetical protein
MDSPHFYDAGIEIMNKFSLIFEINRYKMEEL